MSKRNSSDPRINPSSVPSADTLVSAYSRWKSAKMADRLSRFNSAATPATCSSAPFTNRKESWGDHASFATSKRLSTAGFALHTVTPMFVNHAIDWRSGGIRGKAILLRVVRAITKAKAAAD